MSHGTTDVSARAEARRKALRAARAVSLSVAVAAVAQGCGALAVSPLDDADDAGPRADAAAARPDAARADARPDAPAGEDARRDASPACTDTGDGGWEEYQRCCDENGWNSAAGCFAWGPFMPPSAGA